MINLSEVTIGIRSKFVIKTYKPWLKKTDKVLDIGCGNGILSDIIKNSLTPKITCCDIEKYLKKEVPFVHMKNKSTLPFPNNSFDVVMFNDSLHHISRVNQKKLLIEAFRVAERILIFEDEPNLIEIIVDWGINKLHSRNMPVTLTFRSPDQWIQLFKSLDLSWEYKKVRKPIFYPLTHQAFNLSMASKKIVIKKSRK